MGVQLRVAGAGVLVVVRRRDDARDADLGDGAVVVGDARAGGGDLALQVVEHLGDGRVVGVDDQRLSAGVGDTPQDRDRLRAR